MPIVLHYLAVVVTVFTLSLGVSSCATTDSIQEDRGEIVVTYTVLKLIEQSDTVDADRVLSAVERVRAVVDGEEIVAVDNLTEVVLAQLRLEGLSPADRFLVRSVISRIELDLVGDTETRLLPEGYAERLVLWLGWIENAAYLAGAQR